MKKSGCFGSLFCHFVALPRHPSVNHTSNNMSSSTTDIKYIMTCLPLKFTLTLNTLCRADEQQLLQRVLLGVTLFKKTIMMLLMFQNTELTQEIILFNFLVQSKQRMISRALFLMLSFGLSFFIPNSDMYKLIEDSSR